MAEKSSTFYDLLKWFLEVVFGKRTPTPPTTPPQPPTTPPEPVPPSSAMVQQLLTAHNQERSRIGVGELVLNFKLTLSSAAHTEWMAQNQKMSHNEGSVDPGQRIRSTGYKAQTWGENIAMGYNTVAAVMNGWMNSAGHKANILRAAFTEVGFGIVQDSRGRYWWTANFGRPQQGFMATPPEGFISGPLIAPEVEDRVTLLLVEGFTPGPLTGNDT